MGEVIRSASSLRERLGAIADAAYGMVGEAAEDAEERLEGEGVVEAEEAPEAYGHGAMQAGGPQMAFGQAAGAVGWV